MSEVQAAQGVAAYWVVLAGLICLVIGAIAGAWIGANNAKDVEKIIANAKAELARTQKKADEIKAQLISQGIKL
jgi:hypothetical protein